VSVVGSMPPLWPAEGGTPGFFRSLFALRTIAGASGLAPAVILMALSGVERHGRPRR
jgi:hypothetical protein